MGLFFSVSLAELLKARNNILVDIGIPALEKNGFHKAPFQDSFFGRNNVGGYSYELCRVSKSSQLEIITAHLSKGDRWFKIYLNVFQLRPVLNSVEPLKRVDGMQFRVPPKSQTQMRLDMSSRKVPLFGASEHRIRPFFTAAGFKRRIVALSRLIERDLNNIDFFIQRWHKLHQIGVTDWYGNIIN